MIIDAHCHVWPDQLAARLIAARPAGLDAVGDGTVSGLLRTIDAAGIEMACTLAIANEARHVQRTNEFIGGVDRSRFIPVGTVHTGLSVDQNLRSLADNGIRAVKFHPNFQQISLGDPALRDIFMGLAEQGIPVLAHVGVGSDAAATERGAPPHLLALLTAVPTLRLVAFHFGGYHLLDMAERDVVGHPGLYIETSWPPSVGELGTNRIRDIIARHGADRVVFGSDWPMTDPGRELDVLRSLGLSASDQRAVLGGTLGALLGVERTD